MKKINDEISRAAADRVSQFLNHHNLLFLQLFHLALLSNKSHEFTCFKPSRINLTPYLARKKTLVTKKKEIAVELRASQVPVQIRLASEKKGSLKSKRLMRWRQKEYATATRRLKHLEKKPPSEKKHEITSISKQPAPKKNDDANWSTPQRQEERQFQISRF